MADKKKKNLPEASWFSNVAKSLGYSFLDIAEETLPATIDTVKSNKDFIVETAKTLRSLRGNRGSLKSMLSDKTKAQLDIVQNAISSSKSAIKTGKFYTGPSTSFGDDDDEFGDFDVSFDDDLSDDSFNDSDDNERSGSPSDKVKVNVVSNISDDNPMVQGISEQTRTMITLAETEAKRDIVLADSQMKLSTKLHGAIGAVNENVSHLVRFASRDGASYINASLRYYDESITKLSEISSALGDIKTALAKPSQLSSYDNDSVRWDDVIMSSGGINLENYSKMVKKNFRRALDNNMITSALIPLIEEPDNLKTLLDQPMSFIPKAIANKIIPNVLKSALTSFDNTFKAFIPAMLTRVANLTQRLDDPTGILEMIGTTFGIKTDRKTSIDVSKYEKGPVPFDGITKKAITEVIPGYLSKILSTLSGKNPQIYDYETGEFVEYSKISERHKADIRQTATRNYDSIDKIKDNIRNNNDITHDDQKRLNDAVDSYFEYLAKHNVRMIKPERTDEFVQQILDFNGSSITRDDATKIANAVAKLKSTEKMNIVGVETLNARQSITDYFNRLEAGDSSTRALYNNLYTGNEHKGEVSKSNIFSPADKYGKTALDYLRDIKRLMITGVATYKVPKEGAIAAANALNTFGAEETAYAEANRATPPNDSMVAKDKEEQKEEKKKSPIAKFISFITGDRAERKNVVDKFFEKAGKKGSELLGRVDKFMYNLVFGFDKDDNSGSGDKENRDGSFLNKLVTGITSPIKRFYNWTTTSLLNPIKDFFFGKDGLAEKIKNSPLFNTGKQQLKRFAEYLFGVKGENGRRTGGLFRDARDQLYAGSDKVKDYFAGRNGDPKRYIETTDGGWIDKETGERVDESVVKDAKRFRDDTVFGSIRDMGKGITDSIKETFSADKTKGIFADIKDSLKTGFSNFGSLLFGTASRMTGNNDKIDINTDEMIDTVKQRAPKAVAGGIIGLGVGAAGAAGGLGILGQLFLGPMGGAAIGMTTAFLSQSDKFKNWLFGKTDENGERVGGIISKSTQEFFKKNKKDLAVGGTIGAVAGTLGLGVLPSFILGGPVGGAVAGMGVALLSKSESLQKFLFGEMDEDGKRSGGKLSKFFNSEGKLTKESKSKLATVGVGAVSGAMLAKFGLIGGLTVNPILGAAAGIGAGLIASSDSFRKKLFGEFDDDGNKTKAGVFDDLKAKFDVNIIQPMKIKFLEAGFNVKNWFDDSIAEPMMQAFDPIKEEVKYMGERLAALGKTIVDKFMQSKPMKSLTSLVTKVGKGILFALDKTVKGISSIVGKVISAPFKLIGAIGRAFLQKQMKRSKKSILGMAKDNIVNGIKKSPLFQTVSNHISTIADTLSDIRKGFTGFVKRWIMDKVKSAKEKAVEKAKAGVNWVKNTKVGRGISSAVGAVKNVFKPKDVDAETLDRLEDIKSGNRTIGQSIRDTLNLTFLRKSKLSRAAMADGVEYLPEWLRTRDERSERRKKEREDQKSLLESLRAKNKENKNILKAATLGLSEEDREKVSNEEFNKIIDKFNSKDQKEFDKKYKKGSKETAGEKALDHDRFKMEETRTSLMSRLLEVVTGMSDYVSGKKSKENSPETTPESSPQSSPATEAAERVVTTSSPDEQQAPKKKRYIKNENGKWIDTVTGDFVKSSKAEAENTSTTSGEATMNQLQHDTPGESSYEIREESAEDADKKEKRSWFNKITGLLSRGNDEQKKHNFSWSSIFSKKGLITSALLLGIPWLMSKGNGLLSGLRNVLKSVFTDAIPTAVGWITKAIREILYGREGSESRTDATGNTQINSNAASALVTGVHNTTRSAIRTADKVYSAARSVKNAVTGGAKAGTRAATEAAGEVLEGGAKAAIAQADDLLGAGARAATNAADDIGEAASKANKGLFSKFLGLVKTSLGKLVDWIAKKFGIKGGLTPKITKAIAAVNNNWFTKHAKVVLKKIIGLFSKMGISVTASGFTAGLTDVAMVGIGAGAGAYNAANLFQVPEENVDGLMRTISAAFGGILNLSWFWVLDLLNEFVASASGLNLKHELAVMIYKALASEEQRNAFDAADKKFKEDYTNYTKVQQIAKGNVKRDEAGNIVYDEDGNPVYEDSSKIESLSSYNDRTNKTLGSKIMGGIGKGLKWTWDRLTLKTTRTALFGSKGNKEKYDKAVEGINNLQEAAANGEIDPNSKEYKETLAALEKERDANAEKKGAIRKVGSFLAENTTVGKAVASASKSMSSIFETINAKREYNKITKKIKKLDEAVEDGEIDPDDPDFQKARQELETEREKYARAAGKSMKDDLKNIGKNVAKAGFTLLNPIGTAAAVFDDVRKLLLKKPAKEAYDKANNNIKQLLKGVESGDIDPSSKEFTQQMTKLEKIRNDNANILGINPHDYPKYMTDEELREYKYAAAKTNLNNINTKIDSGELNKDDRSVKQNISYYKGVMEQNSGTGGLPKNAGGALSPSELLAQYTVTSGYENRVINGNANTHNGIDLSKPVDSPVESFTPGTVYKVVSGITPNTGYYGSKAGGGFGNYVVIKDPKGNYNYYAHMNSTSVQPGDTVDVGDKLGTLGHTGSSTGPHLHYEVRKQPMSAGRSNTFNPTEYLNLDPSIISSGSSSNTKRTSSKNNAYGLFSSLFTNSGKSSITQMFDTIKEQIRAPLKKIFSGLFSNNNASESSLNDSVNYNSSSSSFSGTATNLREELIQKTLELTNAHEGNYNSVNANDNGSYSVGTIQFHGNLAKDMFNRMAAEDPSIANEAKKYASWSNRALTKAEAKEMSDFLTNNAEVAKRVQYSFATDLVANRNLKVPLRMFDSGVLKDPRSVVLAADIGNSGPAHLNDWEKHYTPVSTDGKSDLLNVKNSLQSSDSFWGRATSNKYYKGWMNRIDSSYNKLSNWTPKYGVGGETPVYRGDIFTGLRQNTNENPVVSLMNRVASSEPSNSAIGDKITEFFSNVISLLKEISVNTKNTTEGINNISSGQPSSNPISPTIINANSSNPLLEIAENRRAQKKRDGYSVAKKIAAGGVV